MTDPDRKEAALADALKSADKWEESYKAHVTATILKAITDDGRLDTYAAYRQVVAVTNRTLSTVKNWFTYQTNPPDLVSLARICAHWNIPAGAVIPPDLLTQLSTTQIDKAVEPLPLVNALDLSLDLIPLGQLDGPIGRQHLQVYTKNPDKVLLIRQDDSENDQIRLGELVMIDPTVEEFKGGGYYLLKLYSTVCFRYLEPMAASPSVKLSRVPSPPQDKFEIIPLAGKSLPPDIAVLGKAVAIVRMV